MLLNFTRKETLRSLLIRKEEKEILKRNKNYDVHCLWKMHIDDTAPFFKLVLPKSSC